MRTAALAPLLTLMRILSPPSPVQFVHTGGGVAVRYEAYEKDLKRAGHQVRVLCPDRRTVDTWVVGGGGVAEGYPANGLTWSNFRRLVHCWRWCDVCIAPENDQLMTLALLSRIFNKRLVINVHTNVPQMLKLGVLTPLATLVYYFALRVATCSSLCNCYTVSDANKGTLESNGLKVSGVYELKTRQVKELTAKQRKAIRDALAPMNDKNLPIVLFAGRWLEEKVSSKMLLPLKNTGDPQLP